MTAKKAGIKIIAEALKIAINAIFGKMGGEHEWFYDLEALYKVTINGQLFLLMLIERLTEAGIDVFYGNTDGITSIVKLEQEEEFYRICKEWEEELHLELEYVEIEKMMLRDVNNYTLRTTSGYIKEKGDFLRNPPLGKNVDARIVAKATHEWFYNGTPIGDTILNEKNLFQFMMTGKVGDQFDAVAHTLTEGELVEIPLQHVNRYYAAKDQGAVTLLKKRKKDNGFENLLNLSQVYICNDYKNPLIPINHDYYINRTRRLLASFETQQKLF